MNHFKRPKIFAGNWKMNFAQSEAFEYFVQMHTVLVQNNSLKPKENEYRVIFPQAFCLNESMIQVASSSYIELGAQNSHWENSGAFTGEISPLHLKKMNINWTLIAHSERRQFFGETDELASKRLLQAIKNNLNIIYCVGETLSERNNNETKNVLTKQVSFFLKVLKDSNFLNTKNQLPTKQIIALAYEPVWAIGTGKTATPELANEAHHWIREILKIDSIPILYGGSVNPSNAKELLNQNEIDGVLVGGASLKVEEFSKILSL
jgi:triosephosphate isomerase